MPSSNGLTLFVVLHLRLAVRRWVRWRAFWIRGGTIFPQSDCDPVLDVLDEAAGLLALETRLEGLETTAREEGQAVPCSCYIWSVPAEGDIDLGRGLRTRTKYPVSLVALISLFLRESTSRSLLVRTCAPR